MDSDEYSFSPTEPRYDPEDLDSFIQWYWWRFPEKEEPPHPEAADLHPAPARRIESPEVKHYPGFSNGDQDEEDKEEGDEEEEAEDIRPKRKRKRTRTSNMKKQRTRKRRMMQCKTPSRQELAPILT